MYTCVSGLIRIFLIVSIASSANAAVSYVDGPDDAFSSSLELPVSSVAIGDSPITVTSLDYSFDCDASGGDVTFNLMSSSLVPGHGFEFSTVSSGKCFVNPAGGETLNGFANYSGLDTQYESILIRSNGTGWTIKAAY